VGAGVFCSIGGFLLSLIWYSSTKKTQDYVRHCWRSIQAIKGENGLALKPFDFAQQLETQGKDEYRRLPKSIPLLFGVAWGLLFITAVVRFVCFVKCVRFGDWGDGASGIVMAN